MHSGWDLLSSAVPDAGSETGFPRRGIFQASSEFCHPIQNSVKFIISGVQRSCREMQVTGIIKEKRYISLGSRHRKSRSTIFITLRPVSCVHPWSVMDT